MTNWLKKANAIKTTNTSDIIKKMTIIQMLVTLKKVLDHDHG